MSAPEALTASWKIAWSVGRVMPFMAGTSGRAGRVQAPRRAGCPAAVWKRDPFIANPCATASSARPSASSARIAFAGLDDPDAVDVPLRVDLDDVDVDVALAQRDRGGEAADAAADDEDAHQLKSPVAAFASSSSGGANSTGGNDSNIDGGRWLFL